MDKLKDIGLRLLDPVIFLAVVATILQVFVINGLLGDMQVDTITKSITSVVNVLIMIGIMKQPNSTKKDS